MPSKPASRLTDMHTCPMVTGLVPHVGGPIIAPGQPTTLIGGLPAARVGDMCVCAGPPDVIATGAFTVTIGGKPAARMGDTTAHGGMIVSGLPTVLIGDTGGGAGSPQGMTMRAARAAGTPFTSVGCDRAAALESLAGSSFNPPAAAPRRSSWLEIELVDQTGQPVAYQRYRIVTPTDEVHEGWTDASGVARVANLADGECQISLPDQDGNAWARA